VDLRELECFVTLADELHFGRAAAKLHVDTSTLSKRIRQLERELGLHLFTRTTRQVSLSAAGALLREHAHKVLGDASALLAVARETASGHIGEVRASYAPGTGEDVAALVRAMRADEPAVTIVLEQGTSAEVAVAVDEGRVTFGVCNLAPPPELRAIESLILNTLPIGYVFLPHGHRLTAGTEVSIRDLSGERLVAPPAAIQDPMPYLNKGDFRHIKVELFWASAMTEDAMLDLVAAGFGLFLCTEPLVRRNRRDDVVMRPLAGRLPLLHHRMLWRGDDDSAVLRSILGVARALREALRQPAPALG
jgi:DNA-binding transcriptional LysR family regulator